MLGMNDLSVGKVFKYNSAPHIVIKSDHLQMGRGSAVVRTKIRNLLAGQVLEVTFKPGDKIEEADLSRSRATYLYSDEANLYFMDSQSYEQFTIPKSLVGDNQFFICENSDVGIFSFEDKPVSVELPKKVELKVAETAPGIRGNTAQGSVMKPAVLSTGLKINVPLFVKDGDTVRVNTETQQYVERV
ncbi:elongation factor P [Patescibacteria group bacterium]|nr:elongation factor P [Patescibacteria group bacterium]